MFQIKHPKTPTIPYNEIKKFHLSQGQEKRFLAFQHCARNLFIRERLYFKQHGLCPICGKQIIDLRLRARIHHNTYDHCCESLNPEIMVHCPQKMVTLTQSRLTASFAIFNLLIFRNLA